jgi:hypothetical protein
MLKNQYKVLPSGIQKSNHWHVWLPWQFLFLSFSCKCATRWHYEMMSLTTMNSDYHSSNSSATVRYQCKNSDKLQGRLLLISLILTYAYPVLYLLYTTHSLSNYLKNMTFTDALFQYFSDFLHCDPPQGTYILLQHKIKIHNILVIHSNEKLL